MIFDREAFEEWRSHVITEEVFRALEKLADKSKQEWINQSWDGARADPMMLVDLRARAEVANDLRELTYEELEDILDDESKRNQSDRIQSPDPAQGG